MTWVKATRKTLFLLALTLLAHVSAANGQTSDKAVATIHGSTYALSNGTIESAWTLANNKIATVTVTDKQNNTLLLLSDPFALLLKDGTIYKIDNLQVDGAPQMQADRKSVV